MVFMQVKRLEELIELRKALRGVLTRVILEVPELDLDEDIQECLEQLEQIVIRLIAEVPLPIDEGSAPDEDVG